MWAGRKWMMWIATCSTWLPRPSKSTNGTWTAASGWMPTDLQIVVTNGRMVPDDTKKRQEDLHPPFMTWRQQIDGHYWFPVYTKGEGILHFSGGYGYMDQDVHIRDVVKYTDYKRFGSTTKLIYEGQDITQGGQQPGQQPNQPPPAPSKPK